MPATTRVAGLSCWRRWFPIFLAAAVPALMVMGAVFPLIQNNNTSVCLYRVHNNGTSVPNTGSLKISAGFAVAQKSTLAGAFFATLIWVLSLTDDVPMCFGVASTGKFEAVFAAIVSVMLLLVASTIKKEVESPKTLAIFEDPLSHNIADQPSKGPGYALFWAAAVASILQLCNNAWCRISQVTRKRDHMGWREPFWEIRPLVKDADGGGNGGRRLSEGESSTGGDDKISSPTNRTGRFMPKAASDVVSGGAKGRKGGRVIV